MAIAHFNVAIVGRSSGKSSVHAAAYASRMDLTDERTGTAYRYARKSGDVVSSFVWLPKDAPEELRSRATLWNAIEKIESRKNSQLARRIILALPHELTERQREFLLKDFVRENFTRKGLAADVSIHKPDAKGDERNFHAHILVPTRFIDKAGIGKKDRASNEREAMQQWRDDWEKKVNYQLERHGHETRISMKSLEAQGIDRTPQIHLGQGASALDRKGLTTDRAEQLRAIVANDRDESRPVPINLDVPAMRIVPELDIEQLQADIANDDDAGRAIANDLGQAETVDRDAEAAAWQDRVDAAGIAYAEERRQAFLATQASERETVERHGREMAARHAGVWHEVVERHRAATAGYQEGSIEEAAEAMTTGFSLFLGWFASIVEGITGGHGSRRTGRSQADQKKERERQAEQQKEAQAREMEAVLQEQAREKEQHERRRALMVHQQKEALAHFEQEMAEKSSLQQAFRVQGDYEQSRRYAAASWDKQRIAPQEPGKDKGPSRDGPELG